MAEVDIEQEIENGLLRFENAMASLGITVTPAELEEKRQQLRWQLAGTGSEVAVREGKEAESWEEVAATLQQDPNSVAILDDYVKLDDKGLLINVPFFINSVWFSEGDMGVYATLKIITHHPIRTPAGDTSKIVITDGSTGIHDQLRKLVMETGQTTRIMVRNGLRVSQYTVDTDEGTKNAETFYLT